MTNIAIGSAHIIGKGTGRLIYLGDGKADIQLFFPSRGPTGGLLNDGTGEWKTHKSSVTLTQAQLATLESTP